MLYVANIQIYTQDFTYRKGSAYVSRGIAPMGVIAIDEAPDVEARIIADQVPYGMVARSSIDPTVPFLGLCYDPNPIETAGIFTTVDRTRVVAEWWTG